MVMFSSGYISHFVCAFRGGCSAGVSPQVWICMAKTAAFQTVRDHQSMILNAGCRIAVETTVPTAVGLMLEPMCGAAQLILHSSVTIDPPTPFFDIIDGFGNSVQRLVLPEGRSVITAETSANVHHAIDEHLDAPFVLVQDLPYSVLQFLLPSRFCQSDLLLELAVKVTAQAAPGYAQVAAIRDWIHQNIEYKYGASGPTTSALDTASSRQGVCRDYAHLGISLCRALRIPARMVSGYLYQLEPMDLHVWFEAFVGDRWYTIDATQNAPRGNRIIVGYGRDAADIALMSPYGEVTLKEMSVYVEAADAAAH